MNPHDDLPPRPPSRVPRTLSRHPRQRLTAAAWGELDEHSRAELHAHLEQCPTCDAEHAFEHRLQRALTAQPAPTAAPPPLYFEGMLAEIHRRMPDRARAVPPRRWRRGEWRAHLGSAAMGLVLLLWLGAMGGSLRSGAWINGPAAVPRATLPAPSAAATPRLIALDNAGLMPVSAELLALSDDQWDALGLPTLTDRDRAQLALLRRLHRERLIEEG